MTSVTLYSLAGAGLFALGLWGLTRPVSALRRLLAVNVMGIGVFMVLVAQAYNGDAPPDPVPHAMVLTGIVVAVSATALGVALARRAEEDEEDP
jgi:multicomponent Na+:H+ antiporter subunit C